VSKSHYSYPPDEFDVRGPEDAPVGVHREPRSGWSSVWPFLLVAVVCGGIAVGAVSFLSKDDTPSAPPAAEQTAGAGSEEGSGDASEEPSGDASEEPSDDTSDDASEEPGDEATELPGDPSQANLDARVVVYNDGAGQGQAGAGQGVVADAGFSDVAADDAVNAPVELADAYSANTVLYGADRADTASAVAEALGIDPANVQESDDVTASPSDAVWVVLTDAVG